MLETQENDRAKARGRHGAGLYGKFLGIGTYADRYMLIGGTACDLAMREAGLEFRATKDLDIVLCVESLDTAFVEAFWAFVREGEYQVQQRAEGGRQFYRFQKPMMANFPFMLGLFSRSPEHLPIAQGSHLTPIPTAEEVSSLSAILMDDFAFDVHPSPV